MDCNALSFRILPEADVDSTDPTALRWSADGVRVSATLRRGAAPYADGAQRLVEARMHDCLLLLVGQRLGPGGIYVEFCVRHNGTSAPACPTCSHPFSLTVIKLPRPCSNMLLSWTPSYNPRASGVPA